MIFYTVVNELNNAQSSEQGKEILEKHCKEYNKKDFYALLEHLEISFKKSLNITALKSKIIENTITHKLNYRAIQNV